MRSPNNNKNPTTHLDHVILLPPSTLRFLVYLEHNQHTLPGRPDGDLYLHKLYCTRAKSLEISEKLDPTHVTGTCMIAKNLFSFPILHQGALGLEYLFNFSGTRTAIYIQLRVTLTMCTTDIIHVHPPSQNARTSSRNTTRQRKVPCKSHRRTFACGLVVG